MRKFLYGYQCSWKKQPEFSERELTESTKNIQRPRKLTKKFLKIGKAWLLRNLQPRRRVGLRLTKNPRWWVHVFLFCCWWSTIFSYVCPFISHIESLLNSLEDRRGLGESTFIASRRRRKKDRLMNERKNWRLHSKVCGRLIDILFSLHNHRHMQFT